MISLINLFFSVLKFNKRIKSLKSFKKLKMNQNNNGK